MKRKILENLINDVLESSKYPDGTLKDREEIIDKYLEKFNEVFEDYLILNDWDYYEIDNTLVDKYIGNNKKVKISAKKGKIVIEKIN